MDNVNYKFKLRLGDGGRFVEGKAKYNEENEYSYEITKFSIPMDKQLLQTCIDYMGWLEKLCHEFDGIKEVIIKKTESGEDEED